MQSHVPKSHHGQPCHVVSSHKVQPREYWILSASIRPEKRDASASHKKKVVGPFKDKDKDKAKACLLKHARFFLVSDYVRVRRVCYLPRGPKGKGKLTDGSEKKKRTMGFLETY